MSLRFTGERLHEGEELFAVDLARHHAAYEFARERLRGARVLDLGCGSGYGTASLAADTAFSVGIDRIAPDADARRSAAAFCRADIDGLPLAARSFDAVTSFQVIEHLERPGDYLDAMGRLIVDGGQVIVSTPNRVLSDGVNPYHLEEYDAAEMRALLDAHFAEVELLGVGMSEAVRAYMRARSQRIQRIMRLDPLRLRERLPRAWIERLFALGARIVRRCTGSAEGTPDASWRDFPIEAADDATSIDWIAVCRRPRAQAGAGVSAER